MDEKDAIVELMEQMKLRMKVFFFQPSLSGQQYELAMGVLLWDELGALVSSLTPPNSISMQDLATLHEDHITKPSFDSEMEQEQEIEILTSNITSLFHKCQKLIQVLNRKGRQTRSDQQKRLAANVVSSIAKEVQNLSMDFRKSQSAYLRREFASCPRCLVSGRSLSLT